MLGAFANAFRTPDLRRKILFVLFIIVIYRVGASVPAPGVNYVLVNQQLAGAGSDSLLGMINMFSGGALLQLSIFALGIMPYITASIILQLLTVVIPRLEALKKEGQQGQAKITQYTRYLTLGLALLQSAGFVAMARQGSLGMQSSSLEPPGFLVDDNISTMVIVIITMTAGTGLIMWLGELITERGIGNGMSILIFTSIVSSFPGLLWQLKTTEGWPVFIAILVLGLVVTAVVVYIEQAQRRIPVQYAKRMVGRRAFGGSSTYIPLKVNQANVVPVIFTSSLMYLPMLAASFNQQAGWAAWLQANFTRGDHPLYMIAFFLLTVFFTYFYVPLVFNPEEVADNMKKYGGFIPGIRAGRPTQDYLAYVLSRLTFPGSMYLGILALLPLFAIAMFTSANQNFPFGGTSLLIMVGVGLDTVKQIESQLQQRHYEGFLR